MEESVIAPDLTPPLTALHFFPKQAQPGVAGRGQATGLFPLIYSQWMTDAADQFQEEELSLSELLERYAMLRDTIQGLESEREVLGAQLKAALAGGEQAETELYRAVLKVSRRIEYPLDRFREVFGDAAALEVATVDRKKADALAVAGDLDGERLRDLGVVKEIHVLTLQPKTR